MKVNVYLNPWYTFYFSRVLIMNHYTAKKWIGKKFLGLLKYLSIEFLILDVVCPMTHQAVQTN